MLKIFTVEIYMTFRIGQGHFISFRVDFEIERLYATSYLMVIVMLAQDLSDNIAVEMCTASTFTFGMGQIQT